MGPIWPASNGLPTLALDYLVKRRINIFRDCLPLMRKNTSVKEIKELHFSISTVFSLL